MRSSFINPVIVAKIAAALLLVILEKQKQDRETRTIAGICGGDPYNCIGKRAHESVAKGSMRGLRPRDGIPRQ